MVFYDFVIIFEVNIVAEHVNANFYSAFLHWTQARTIELVVCQNHGRPQGAKRAFCHLEIGTKNLNFLENLTSAA